MRPTIRTLARLAALAALLVAVPAALEAQDSTRQERPARRPRGDRNRITQQDIAQAGAVVTALDVVRGLRPFWLNPPPGRIASSNMAGDTQAARTIVVYIDDVRQPDLETSLVTVPVAKIVEIRYLDQNRAVQMRGPGHEAGVIEVTTTDKPK